MQKLWIIRRQPYRETSALLTILTDDDNLVRCIARGAGRLASEFQPLFGVLSGRGGLLSLSKIELAGPRIPLQGTELISGLYINEITHWLLPEGVKVDSLFDNYTDSISRVSQGHYPALRRLEHFLLDAFGVYPILHMDLSGEALLKDAYYRLHNDQQLIEVNSDDPDALIGANWIALSRANYENKPTARHAKWLHRYLIDRALGGRRLISREMLLESGKTQ